jgi:hypothetical protein
MPIFFISRLYCMVLGCLCTTSWCWIMKGGSNWPLFVFTHNPKIPCEKESATRIVLLI